MSNTENKERIQVLVNGSELEQIRSIQRDLSANESLYLSVSSIARSLIVESLRRK